MAWRITPTNLPCEQDGLSASEEFLYYHALWCQVHAAPPQTYSDLAMVVDFECQNSISRALKKLRDLELLSTERTRVPKTRPGRGGSLAAFRFRVHAVKECHASHPVASPVALRG